MCAVEIACACDVPDNDGQMMNTNYSHSVLFAALTETKIVARGWLVEKKSRHIKQCRIPFTYGNFRELVPITQPSQGTRRYSYSANAS